METVAGNMNRLAQEIATVMDDYLSRSRVTRWVNNSDLVVIGLGGDFVWQDLDVAGARMQGKLQKLHRHYHAVMLHLLEGTDYKGKFTELDFDVSNLVERKYGLHDDNLVGAGQKVRDHLKQQIALLERLYDASDGITLLIPDTNALLHFPSVQDWRFSDINEFSLVLTPPVMRELDEHKMGHRAESVRAKSEMLIRMFKEFGRRGNILEGVPIVTGKVNAIAMATDPQWPKTMHDLALNIEDDRLLATTFEVMRAHPRSAVALVTRDLNLQIKCTMLRVPFREPPDPTPVPATVESPRLIKSDPEK